MTQKGNFTHEVSQARKKYLEIFLQQFLQAAKNRRVAATDQKFLKTLLQKVFPRKAEKKEKE